MIRLEQATDPIESRLAELPIPALIGGGLLSAAVGLLLSVGLARLLAPIVPRPEPPPPRPRLSDLPGSWPALSRVTAWIVLRLGHGPPASFRPALLPVSVLVFLGAAMLGASLSRRLLGGGESAPSGSPDLRAFALTTLLVAAALLATLQLWTRSFGGGLRDLGFARRSAGRALVLAFGLYLAYAPAQLAAMALEQGANLALGRDPPRQVAVVAFSENGALWSDPLVVAGLALFAPLYEELFFRGILQRFLTRLLPGWIAIGTTALCFTLPHDGPKLPVFALGAALSWLMARTGNLYAPLLFHVLHNGLTLFLLVKTGGA